MAPPRATRSAFKDTYVGEAEQPQYTEVSSRQTTDKDKPNN